MDLPQFRNIRFAILLASFVALFLSSAWFLNFNFKKSAEESDWVNHTSQVISELDAVLSGVLNAETGVRGFVITGRPTYLEPYNTGMLDTKNYVARLKQRVGDNFSQVENLDILDQLIETAAANSASVIQKRTSSPLSIQEVDALLLKNKQSLDAIRAQLEKMKVVEKSLLASRGEELQLSRSFFFLSLIATTALSLIFIGFAFYQSKRAQDRAAQDVLKKDTEARIRQDINLLSKSLAGDISLNQTAQTALEFIGIRMDVLASHLFFRDSGKLKAIASYGVANEDSNFGSNKSLSSLVYEAFNRKELWQISEVPHDYWKIRSSLGEATPRQLTFLPIQFQERTIAVIEMASFTKLSDYQLELLNRLVESVAIGLNTSQIRDRTIELLEESRQLAEELQVQQEELRASNEELEQQSRVLEEQQQTLLVRNREVDDARRQLEVKASDLEKSSQYKSDFLAKMSHELRTPLNSLMILSTLLIENKERNLTAQQTQFARSIQNSGQDLLMLINDILDLSKIEARKLSLKADTFSIESLLAPKHNTFGVQARDKGLDFEIELEGDAKTAVLNTDKQRVEQVLRNFISNAIKFTEKGFIKIKARLLENNRLVEFSVKDSGIGIPQDKVDIIFEAFEQADSSVSRQFGGTGLGLTISRELAGLLGGRIRVQSEVGKGSEFTLVIPIQLKISSDTQKMDVSVVETPIITKSTPRRTTEEEIADENHVNTAAYVRKTLDGVDRDKRNILIIEDDDAFRSSIVEAVRNYDFASIEAPNSEIALALLEKMTPDAILLDIKLPGMSGLGLLEIVKRRSELRHVPVHMISGLEYQHSALRMGALGYLTKPVTIEKVNSALERIKNVIAGNPRKVLLIEDDAIQSQAIRSLIAGTDVEVDSAESGKEAIRKLKAEIYDCIILDLKLTDTSGFQLLSDLNGMELSLPPVVIYTGKDLDADEESFLRKYSESIIIKGARSPERLLDEVNLFLHRVESMLPQDKREMINQLRVHEQAYDGKTVLLVDDDLRNIFALTSALEAKGLAVRVAKNGVEALEAVDKFGDIDLVLMDIMMPKMDGYEATRRIRQHANSKVKNLPVIALTAKAMRGDHEKCIEAGASDYLPKPVNMENLSTVLKVWFSSKEV